jgi:hypothetical protein
MSQRDAHESYAVAASRLHWIALIMVLSLTAVVAAMYLLFKLWLSHGPVLPPGERPPQPRLQPHPVSDLAAERAREEGSLESRGWNDPGHTVAHIPIDRAMQLTVRPPGDARPSGRTR